MIQKIVTWRANGKPVAEIADLLNEEYGTRFVSRNISDKIYQMRKAGDDRVSATVEPQQVGPSKENLTPGDIDALANGGEREIQTSYDPKDDAFVHHVVRKPLTKEQKSSKDSVLRALGQGRLSSLRAEGHRPSRSRWWFSPRLLALAKSP